MTRTTQDFAAFLESLKVKNEGTKDNQHQWPLDAPLAEIRQKITDEWAEADDQEVFALNAWDYFEHRCAIAEKNCIPETLAEDIKAYMLAAMGISEKCADNSCPCPLDLEGTCYALEFRKLCEASK